MLQYCRPIALMVLDVSISHYGGIAQEYRGGFGHALKGTTHLINGLPKSNSFIVQSTKVFNQTRSPSTLVLTWKMDIEHATISFRRNDHPRRRVKVHRPIALSV